MDYFFECSITPLRKYILDMEDKIEGLFSHYDEYNEKLKSQILMVTMELLENAEKYSTATSKSTDIHFIFRADDTKISILVSNSLLDSPHYENLVSILKQINEADDIEALYVNRLQYLATKIDLNESGLGLYRIAYEGGFQLSCEMIGTVVSVHAVKNLT